MTYEIPVKIIETNDGGCHILVKAQFDKQLKGWLLIDTGANKTVFDKNLLKEHSRITGDMKNELSTGINASIEGSKKAILGKIQIGKLKIVNYETILINLGYLNNIYKEITNKAIYGLIGGDFLLKYQAIINYKKQLLKLKD